MTFPDRPDLGKGSPKAQARRAMADQYAKDMLAALEKPKTRTVEVEKIVYRDHPADAVLDDLEAVRAKLRRTIPEPEAVVDVGAEPEQAAPPEEIADLFDGRPHGMAAQELLEKHRDLTNLIMMNNASDDDRALHARLTPHVPWLRARGAVEVL